MAAQVETLAFLGLEAWPVEVQVQLLSGVPAFIIVGLPDRAVGESRERVRAALASIGLALPPRRITVNLSPAYLRCAADYQARVSGPLLDRIDLHVEVQGVTAADLVLPPLREGSAEVGARVAAARAIQTMRYAGHCARTNAEADGELLDAVATPDEPGRKLLAQAAEAMKLTVRGYHRMLRVARTIADLAGVDRVGRIHVA